MSRLCVPGKTYFFEFNTETTTGGLVTLSGSPVISGYNVTATTTQFTTGITLSVDYDSQTGRNRAIVDTTDATAYPLNEDFELVITTGTVNGVSAIGKVIGVFNTRVRELGIVQAGILAAGGTTTSFTLPTGRRAGVTTGMVLAVEGVGARFIVAYNSGTGVGSCTLAFASDPSSTAFKVLEVPPAETAVASLTPVDVKAVNGVTVAGDGVSTPMHAA